MYRMFVQKYGEDLNKYVLKKISSDYAVISGAINQLLKSNTPYEGCSQILFDLYASAWKMYHFGYAPPREIVTDI